MDLKKGVNMMFNNLCTGKIFLKHKSKVCIKNIRASINKIV